MARFSLSKILLNIKIMGSTYMSGHKSKRSAVALFLISGILLSSCQKEPLKSCSGKAILNLNNCIDGFDSLIDNLNALYTATSGYLHKASYNINLCEESNKSLT